MATKKAAATQFLCAGSLITSENGSPTSCFSNSYGSGTAWCHAEWISALYLWNNSIQWFVLATWSGWPSNATPRNTEFQVIRLLTRFKSRRLPFSTPIMVETARCNFLSDLEVPHLQLYCLTQFIHLNNFIFSIHLSRWSAWLRSHFQSFFDMCNHHPFRYLNRL